MTPAIALPSHLLGVLGRVGVVRRYPARTLLLSEDDSSDTLYLIISGRVKAFGATPDGREVVYSTQGAGEMFGEISLDGGPRSASVMTLQSTTCVVIPGAQIRALMADHPELIDYILRKLIGLVRRATDDVKSLALGDVYQRLSRLLESLDHVESNGYRVLSERLTHQAIAERIGCSRELVSRILKQLVERGYLSISGQRIVLLKTLPFGW